MRITITSSVTTINQCHIAFLLRYGPPGCGKTMLAKAVAHHTTASFIRVVGSEFVQKYLGEGPRMVRYQSLTFNEP